jgi:hypothetical protein
MATFQEWDRTMIAEILTNMHNTKEENYVQD